jgi:hypothetical protein
MKEKVPRHYFGMKWGILNVGSEMGYNNIKLNSDTVYFLVTHAHYSSGGSTQYGRIIFRTYFEEIKKEDANIIE